MRLLVLVLIVPMLVLGSFGGTSVYWHSHGSEESHAHMGPTQILADASGCWHAVEPGIAANDAELGAIFPVGNQDGVLISIPDHEQMLAQRLDLSVALKAAQVLECFIEAFRDQPEVAEDARPPDGWNVTAPQHLCALTAAQRLVRTSQALLI